MAGGFQMITVDYRRVRAGGFQMITVDYRREEGGPGVSK